MVKRLLENRSWLQVSCVGDSVLYSPVTILYWYTAVFRSLVLIYLDQALVIHIVCLCLLYLLYTARIHRLPHLDHNTSA